MKITEAYRSTIHRVHRKSTARVRRPAGRPRKVSPEIIARIVRDMKAGITKAEACDRAGVTYETAYRYLPRYGNPRKIPDWKIEQAKSMLAEGVSQ